MSEQTYIIGESARITLDVKDIFGSAVDAVDLTLKVKSPAAPIETIAPDQIVNTGLGSYHANLTLNKSGSWYYRWETGNPVTAVAEGQLTVLPSRFNP